jgi:hypothetical protein
VPARQHPVEVRTIYNPVVGTIPTVHHGVANTSGGFAVPAFLSREGLALAMYDRIVATETGKKSAPKGLPRKEALALLREILDTVQTAEDRKS